MSKLSVPASDQTGEWWADAVVYQIYPRSFADGNGDGMGDLRGVLDRLPYLERLGVDAIWLSPFYKSPQADGGYDVADYRQVDPHFGSLEDFDAMLLEAHRRGLKVIVEAGGFTQDANDVGVEVGLSADKTTRVSAKQTKARAEGDIAAFTGPLPRALSAAAAAALLGVAGGAAPSVPCS